MSIQNSSCDTNKRLIVDIVFDFHDFQLKMYHKLFGDRTPPEPARRANNVPRPLAGFSGCRWDPKGREQKEA